MSRNYGTIRKESPNQYLTGFFKMYRFQSAVKVDREEERRRG
jgi:hypothetical protein